jgi:hypothetical protein
VINTENISRALSQVGYYYGAICQYIKLKKSLALIQMLVSCHGQKKVSLKLTSKLDSLLNSISILYRLLSLEEMPLNLIAKWVF